MDTIFGILGRTALSINGGLQEDWGKPRERAVLATLLVHAGRLVPIDALLDWVGMDDDALRSPVSTLQTYAARIRKWLQLLPCPATIYAGKGGCRLDVDKSLIDYHQFRNLITEARTHARAAHPQQAAEVAERALQLWRGHPLDDLRSHPAQAWRAQVTRDQWLPANTILLEALVDLGRFDEALIRLDDLQADHGNDVTLAKLRLSTLAGLSRFSEATPYYLNMRGRLKRDAEETAADHLRRHYEDLTARSSELDTIQLTDPVITPRGLRHDIVDFVGRGDLLEALDKAAGTTSGKPGSGVVILDGMAGVGKTALAVHWAHLIRKNFSDGDFFIDLNGFSDGANLAMATVVDELLIALGYQPDGGLRQRAKELLLSRLLADRQMLVILDNVRNTAQMADLVPLLSNCLVIVTSRQRLTTLSRLTGARRVPVEPMTTDEATQLLSVRLGARRVVAYDDRAQLASLCGGLPLMITVLAEHVATSPAAQLSEYVQQFDRRQLLFEVGEDGDSSANTQAFLLSYQAMAGPERRLFRLLGLHPGPDFSVDAACAYDGRTRAEAKRSLGVLVGAHLLEQPESFDRYQFHDLLREFAAHCAAVEESPDTRRAAERRALSHYLLSANQAKRILYPTHLIAPELPTVDAVEPTDLDDGVRARTWFDRERTNLIAVVDFAANAHHDHAWRIADAVAIFFNRRGYYEDTRRVLESAVSAATASGHREAEASIRSDLGMALMILGDHAAARRCLDAALRFAEDQRHERGQANTLQQLARLEMSRGETAAAIRLFEASIEVAQRSGDHGVLCWSHCRLGEALRSTEQFDLALVHLHHSQHHAMIIGDRSAQASSLAGIGSVHRDRGDHATAAAFCEQALGVVDAMPIPDLAVMTQVTTTLADINLARRDFVSATRHALHAVVLAQRSHSASAEARAREALGDAYFASGEPESAVVAWQHAADVFGYLGNPVRVAGLQVKIEKARVPVDVPQNRALSPLDDEPTTDRIDHPA